MNSKNVVRNVQGLFVLLTCTFPLCVQAQKTSASKTAPEYLPKHLKLWIGGNIGRNDYTVEWNGKALQYTPHEGVLSSRKKQVVYPSPQAWKRFWKQMDGVQIWQWADAYAVPDCDDTHWTVEIEHSGKTQKATGSDCYPSDKEVSLPSHITTHPRGERSIVFERYAAAIRELLGNKSFD